MREVGVQADEILALPILVDAAALRRAGFSLEELVRARGLLGLSVHPPVTNPTLFDFFTNRSASNSVHVQ